MGAGVGVGVSCGGVNETHLGLERDVVVGVDVAGEECEHDVEAHHRIDGRVERRLQRLLEKGERERDLERRPHDQERDQQLPVDASSRQRVHHQRESGARVLVHLGGGALVPAEELHHEVWVVRELLD